MDNERKDEAQELYDRCNKITNISNCLFLFNIAFSFVLIFNFTYREVIAIVSLLTTIVYVLLVNINEIYFSNLAESERRKSLLKESFDVDTTLRDTNKEFQNIFLIIGLKNKESDVLILDANMDYECLKNYCKISISSKIFISYATKCWCNIDSIENLCYNFIARYEFNIELEI